MAGIPGSVELGDVEVGEAEGEVVGDAVGDCEGAVVGTPVVAGVWVPAEVV